MSGLSEAELHVQAMRLVCEALQDRYQQGIEVDWDVLCQMHDQMDAMLQALQHKHRYDSSEIVDLRKDRDAARADIERLRAELEELRKDFESLQWIVENIKTMAGGISVQDADGCSLAVGQIQKYFNAAEYPLCNPQQKGGE